MISVCVITGGTIKTDTVLCLFVALNSLKLPKHLILLKGGYPHQNRNIGVQQALEAKSTHIMFIDADMIFEPDYIQKLIDQKRDIIGGGYNEKEIPLRSTVKLTLGNALLPLPKTPFKATSLPTGFLLVKMSVFSKLKRPYFQAPSGQSIHDFTTEDYYFSEKAREAGFDLWCDPTLKLKHLGDYLY